MLRISNVDAMLLWSKLKRPLEIIAIFITIISGIDTLAGSKYYASKIILIIGFDVIVIFTFHNYIISKSKSTRYRASFYFTLISLLVVMDYYCSLLLLSKKEPFPMIAREITISPKEETDQQVVLNGPNVIRDSREGNTVVRARGIGAASSAATNPTLAKRESLIAAEADAKRKLAAWASGENLEAVSVIKDGKFTRDQIVETLNGYIKGAKVVSLQYNEDGTAEVIMEIELHDQ